MRGPTVPVGSGLNLGKRPESFVTSLVGRESFIARTLFAEPIHRVLDFGCGPGDFTKKVAACCEAVQIVACDIDGDMIEKARMDAPLNTCFEVIDPFGKWPWADHAFDAVILGDVLEHVPDESYVLREASRVVTDNGRIIITVPHKSFTGSWDPSNFRFRWPSLHRIMYGMAHGRIAYQRRYTRPEPFNSSPGVKCHRHYDIGEITTLLSDAHLDADQYSYWGRLDAFLLLWEMVQRNISLPWPHLSANRCEKIAHWNSRTASPVFAYNLGVVARPRR